MTSHSEKQYSSSLPHSVWSADWIRQAEPAAAASLGLSLYALMQRAGAAAYQLARDSYPASSHWLVLCGHGNNGGDGYVVAGLAAAAGIRVTLIACQGARPLPPEAAQARQSWLDGGGEIQPADSRWPNDIDLIIDGLLGTGLGSAPRAPMDALIEAANRTGLPIVALDIPSGLLAQSGAAPGAVIRAAHTLTFIALKPGLLTGQARDWVGQLHQTTLGLSDWLAQQPAPIQRLSAANLSGWLRPRRPCSHKGEHGRLLVVGGDLGFGGAIRMAAEAALRSGAGLVRVLTHTEHLAPLMAARPELMAQRLTDDSLQQALEWADVLVVGPGLGQADWGKNALKILQRSNKPALWDADALNLLAINPEKRQNRVITPHPGEAARLLGCRTAEIESDRLLAARRLVANYGGVVVLKGAGTVIAGEHGEMAIADVGNAGMASGGMGDVLAGIIGGLLAQKLSLYDAACAGCVVHGAAADRVADRQGTRGLLATDLLLEIPHYVNPQLA
ncbi:bifunctional ADP-dependent NAD(P)H-hydrate dehydratase/NAD(P)H-hydrate epimerase [Serratia odorifera]|jgi:ADP-dependent NAD(P)H-hydrate dehydratase / NAD(P)H-hydrate epimerase|uniref:Bifunctional NAD(P)H-hydrate repair enzyme n=2 Tax=Serratia odorifera TaxID=618 RepID=D4DY87_SEROD|nr:bifunctional ADP-dependent NAD(P)H-hydrate dehydratase/NAD(P)H-hydrate epimerase [Serratia odorifera]EFE97579.1 YjeF domain protein [Serratia odorifera DSM 4582]PNK91972.1 bifunctional ADP-dependent NAD(P)H-hydrate dehydratase/NAD(P)H-hydrate epimerase [Serratia odorifera]RII73189.1 bifunctional ADP-dependent NAD(P)H-hydrate dehydratase/NAD(P)H-hydrate epimerase [Serratia odorifera]VDZ53760.1 Nicotinamide nucleotide repair protein [Serratia odorifera]HEJ9097125.1 bifunctional ADP-dependent 